MDGLFEPSEKTVQKYLKLYLKEEKEKVEKMFCRSGGRLPIEKWLERKPIASGKPLSGTDKP